MEFTGTSERKEAQAPDPQTLGREMFFIGEDGSISPRPAADEFQEANARVAEEERRAVLSAKMVSFFSLAASVIVAWFGIFIGVRDETLSLIGFGLEATLDGISSALVLWRFKTPKRRDHQDKEAADRFKAARDLKRERNSGVGIGATFVASSALLLSMSAYKFLSWDPKDTAHMMEEHEGANWGVFLSLPSAVVFGALAVAKFRLAKTLGSAVLQKDALCSVLGAVLALICAVAGIAEEASGDPDKMVVVDSTASAVIAMILLIEGSRTLWHNLGTGWQEEHHPMA